MANLNPRLTVEPGKMGGKPCIRGLRFTVYDMASYLASGMSEDEILKDFPYLEKISATVGRRRESRYDDHAE
jgi:uncharacterized protein (DUF433 family)